MVHGSVSALMTLMPMYGVTLMLALNWMVVMRMVRSVHASCALNQMHRSAPNVSCDFAMLDARLELCSLTSIEAYVCYYLFSSHYSHCFG